MSGHLESDLSGDAGLDAATLDLLGRARAQSRALAESRTASLPPLRPAAREASPSRRLGVRPIALAFAGLAVVLLASGAWALVRRSRQPPPTPISVERHDPQPAPRAVAAPSERPTPPLAPVGQPAPRASAAPKRSPARRDARPIHVPPPSEPATSPRPLLEPDGELILVPPHAVSPPLFNPEEWKTTRSPPRD